MAGRTRRRELGRLLGGLRGHYNQSAGMSVIVQDWHTGLLDVEHNDMIRKRMRDDTQAVPVSIIYTDACFERKPNSTGAFGPEYDWQVHKRAMQDDLAARQVDVERHLNRHRRLHGLKSWGDMFDQKIGAIIDELRGANGGHDAVLCLNTATLELSVEPLVRTPTGDLVRKMSDPACIIVSPIWNWEAERISDSSELYTNILFRLANLYYSLGLFDPKKTKRRLKHVFRWKQYGGTWCVAGPQGFEGKTVPVKRRDGQIADVKLIRAAGKEVATLYLPESSLTATDRQRSYLRDMIARIIKANIPQNDEVRDHIEKAKMLVENSAVPMSKTSALIGAIKPFHDRYFPRFSSLR